MGGIIFITGTDTGVGKTVLTALLLQHLRRRKIRALAMKPFCSGSREDVEILQRLQPGELTDSEMNPYFFAEPLAPFVAAQKQGVEIKFQDVTRHILSVKERCEVLLVEGAGGVMVPLGSNFNFIDLVSKFEAKVLIVGTNRLGVINHTLMTAAVAQTHGKRLAVVLMEPARKDLSSVSNAETLRRLLPKAVVFSLPFLGKCPTQAGQIGTCEKKIKKTLAVIVGAD